jgi:hypothetical protein
VRKGQTSESSYPFFRFSNPPNLTAGAEGTFVADTTPTDAGSVFGWFLEAGSAGDFQKATEAIGKDQATVSMQRN